MVTKVKGSVLNSQDLFGAIALSDLGAVNTDITTALQAVLTAGLPVIVPVGTWLVGGLVVPDNGIIIGMGRKSVLKLKDTANASILTLGSFCAIKDLVLDGNKLNQVGSSFHGINLTNSVRCSIRDVLVQNPKGSGFLIAGTAADNELVNPGATGYVESGIKIAAGIDTTIINPNIYSSDAAATGDGIALVSNGAAITGTVIDKARIKSITGRGISCIGNGSKNVSDVIISEAKIISATSHGIHMINTDTVSVVTSFAKSCGGDGYRLEGDVQNTKLNLCVARGNTGFGMREVVSGSTPNLNSFLYSQLATNGNNAVTKVGAGSVIV